ncbi:P44/Msp2 family outer membrane protein [Hyphococcus flavus]|uniref:P44/Msp2 family outer membrane protein n=1 Tax=Hyphococcus flavus TaxID=1866326 RepID=A0AAE9ZH46_9PROT|nr:P44/Msp2 family outer membrane protein [Hyphococcus flavus]WDI32943.1 P44/Msp2 family outer membrane protein [Hyphococcus flavus]
MNKLALTAAASALAMTAAAHANDYYVSLSGGVSLLGDSDNEGAFDGDFTTGEGTTIPGGTVLPDGTDVGWETDFDTGYAVSGAIGKSYGAFRGEIEIAYQTNDVGTHTGVTAAGIALDGEDAGVLITGSPNLGVTVGDLVADGQGDLSNLFVMANVFYDFDTGGPLKPYIGAGVGVGFVDVDYSPSATPIIQDDATAFAYQGIAGLAYEVSPATDLFVAYRYRATTDVSVEADLFSADFDIENRASLVEAGLRFRF